MRPVYIYLFTLIMLLNISSFAQSKQALRDSLAAVEARYASLLNDTTSSDSMQMELDSLQVHNTELANSLDAATLLIGRILYGATDSTNTHFSIPEARDMVDSILASRDGVKFNDLRAHLMGLRDSVVQMKEEVDSLRFENATMKDLFRFLVGGQQNIYQAEEVTGQWTFMLDYITFMEDTSSTPFGIMSQPAADAPESIHRQVIKKLNILDDELAEILFFDGSKSKCFYRINDFSRTKPFTVDLKKVDDENYHLAIQQTYSGIQVSYRLPSEAGKGFMFGYMKK